MTIGVLEPKELQRCQATTVAEIFGGPYSLQCESSDDHIGHHHAAISKHTVYIWPSAEDVADAIATADLDAKSDEQVMEELSGGDPAERDRIEEWAKGTARFTAWAAQRQREITAIRTERDELADRLAFARDGYTSLSARGCPVCVYEDGVFVRLCAIHAAAKEEYDWLATDHAKLQQKADNLERSAEQMLRDLAEKRAQKEGLDQVRGELYEQVAKLEGELEHVQQEWEIDRIVLGDHHRMVEAMQPVVTAAMAMRKGHEGCVTEPACGNCFRCVFDQACDAYANFIIAEMGGPPP